MKRDTASNWEQNNPVLLNGEIIIVDTASGEVRFKIGDGTKLYKQLPFSDEAVRALISAKQDEISLTENKAVISDASGKLSVSEVTSTELSYLDGVSSNLQTQIDNKVPTTRKINSKPLSSDITLTASDVNAVPTTRKINGKALSADITLSATDVNALPSSTTIPSKTSQLTNDSNFVTSTQLDNKVDKVTGKGLSTNDYTSAEKTKLSGIETGAQKNTITGVKGSAETTYRTGNVNITATNIGLGNVDNTSDVNKPISNAMQAALNDKQSKITANGILKGNGTGGVSAAVKGTDYFTPADVNEIAAEAAKKVDISGKVSKSGDTMTGKLTVPQVETGDGNSNFFQCRKFRGEGDANTYYHAIDFGYQNHDQVDFHEYGGKWNFYKNQTGKVNDGVLCGSITSNGWEGRAKLKSGSTMVTSQLTENSDAIATTAFVHGLVDTVNVPTVPSTTNILKGNGTGGVSAAAKGTDYAGASETVTATLLAASWTGSSAPYTYTLAVTGVTANSNQELLPALNITEEQLTALQSANIQDGGQAANSVILTAFGDKPTINLPIRVIVRGDS